MSWSVQNPTQNDISSYQAVFTHTNGVSFLLKYAGAGFDTDADVVTAFESVVNMVDGSADFTTQAAGRNKAGSDVYTP